MIAKSKKFTEFDSNRKFTWPTSITTIEFASADKTSINNYYGENKNTWWDNKIEPTSARYLFIHFEKAWDNAGTKPAASMMKVAELDIY